MVPPYVIEPYDVPGSESGHDVADHVVDTVGCAFDGGGIKAG